MAPRQAARPDRIGEPPAPAFHAFHASLFPTHAGIAPAACPRHAAPAATCPALIPGLPPACPPTFPPPYPRALPGLSTTCPRFIPSLSPDSSTGLSTASRRLVPARSTGCPPTCPQAARRRRRPRSRVRGRHPRPARLPPSDVNLRKLTSPLASRTFAGTRRESVRQPGFRAAAPPKGHTHKLSGKRTDRVGTHTRSPGCASGFSYSGERQ